MYRFGWFSTGRDKAARDLLKAAYDGIKDGDIKAEIAFVFCSREPGESNESDNFIELVKSYNIPLVCYSYQKYKAGKKDSPPGEELPEWRLDYDREVMRRLKDYNVDLCVLAGYMLITGREMCSYYNMINLHPAAPGGPAGTWQEVIWQLMQSKAKETGVMMHLVTPELDKGPVVSYCKFSITGNDYDEQWQKLEGQDISNIKAIQGSENQLFRTIRSQGLKREFPLILVTMKAFSRGDVKIMDGRVANAKDDIINGCDLTGEIENIVKLDHKGGD